MDAGTPASGSYDLQFALFDAVSGGAQVGATLIRSDVVVTSGLFTVSLDFGAAFSGSERWLELAVRPGASTGAYATLAGRQELTPSPNAVFSSAAPWSGISGKPGGFADDVDNDTLGALPCPNGQVAKRVAGAWDCADDLNSGGDITAVTAGTGLNGGGASGAVALDVSFGGGGAATTVARSDHDHLGQVWSGSFATAPAFRVINTGAGGFVDGVLGQSDASNQARGLVGYAPSATGVNIGVWGQADSTQGRGVFGYVPAASGATSGVWGQSDSTGGYGGYFENTSGGPAIGLSAGGIRFSDGTTQTTAGLGDITAVTAGSGLTGGGASGAVVLALNTNIVGATQFDFLSVSNEFPTGATTAITGRASSAGAGRGVMGIATGSGVNYGVYGQTFSNSGYGGYFVGNVQVVGTLSKSGGAFKIDHPLDPENKYLYHSFVESPDMMNIYNGNVTTDSDGYASVELPDWLEALNRDFRYQLTVIGQFAQAIVAQKVEGNRFAIRTDKPSVEVSWQVTGIRKDAYAEAHRIPVEEDKPEAERGKYLHPLDHGQPLEKGVDRDHLH